MSRAKNLLSKLSEVDTEPTTPRDLTATPPGDSGGVSDPALAEKPGLPKELGKGSENPSSAPPNKTVQRGAVIKGKSLKGVNKQWVFDVKLMTVDNPDIVVTEIQNEFGEKVKVKAIGGTIEVMGPAEIEADLFDLVNEFENPSAEGGFGDNAPPANSETPPPSENKKTESATRLMEMLSTGSIPMSKTDKTEYTEEGKLEENSQRSATGLMSGFMGNRE